MEHIYKEEFNNGQKVLIVLMTFFVAFVLSNVIGYYIPELLKVNIMRLKPEMVYEINIVKLMQFFSSFVLFVIPPIVISILFKHNIREYLKLKNSPNFIFFVFICIFMILAYPLLSLITEWNGSIKFPATMEFIEKLLRTLEDSSSTIVLSILSGCKWYDLIINLIVIALLPAIGEEMVFRGLIQKYFIKYLKNPHISIIITAIIFSSVHLSFFGFFPRFILGVFLGYLAFRFNSLFPSIFAHFFNNAVAVCSVFYLAKTNQLINMDETNYYPESPMLFIGFILLAVFIGFLIFGKLKTIENKDLSK